MKIRQYPKVLVKQRTWRTPQYPQQARFNNPSPLVVDCHTVVLLNSCNRQQLELTVHSWELESFPKRQVDTRQQIRQQSGVGEVKTWIGKKLLFTWNPSPLLWKHAVCRIASQMRKRYGGHEAESDSHSTPEDASAHNNLSEDSITSYSAFFFADLVRGRAAPFVTVPFTNIASPIGQRASQNQNNGMSFTILREGAISHPALLHFADLCLTFVRQISLFLVEPSGLS